METGGTGSTEQQKLPTFWEPDEAVMKRINPIGRWFRPKTFGIGWTPASPEGWVLTLGGVVLLWMTAHGF